MPREAPPFRAGVVHQYWEALLAWPDLPRRARDAVYAHITRLPEDVPRTWLTPLLARTDLERDEVRVLAPLAAGQWHRLPWDDALLGDLCALGHARPELPPPWELLRRPELGEATGVALLRREAPFGWGTHDWTPDLTLIAGGLRHDAPLSWLEILLQSPLPEDDDNECTLGRVLRAVLTRAAPRLEAKTARTDSP